MLELPESETDVVVHVSVPLSLAVAPGLVALCETTTEPVAVDELAAKVAVTLYVPATETEGFCDVDEKLFGPVH